MNDREANQILEDFAKYMISGMRPLEAEYSQIVNDHFWELLYDGPNDSTDN